MSQKLAPRETNVSYTVSEECLICVLSKTNPEIYKKITYCHKYISILDSFIYNWKYPHKGLMSVRR